MLHFCRLSPILPSLPSYPPMNLTSLALVLPLHPFCKPYPSWTTQPAASLAPMVGPLPPRRENPASLWIRASAFLVVADDHVCLDTLSHSSEQLLQAAPTFPGPIPSALDETTTPESSSPSCPSACPGLTLLPHLNSCPTDFLSFFFPSFFKIEAEFS